MLVSERETDVWCMMYDVCRHVRYTYFVFTGTRSHDIFYDKVFMTSYYNEWKWKNPKREYVEMMEVVEDEVEAKAK